MKRSKQGLLWIPLTAILLVPVARHLSIHGHGSGAGGGEGVLLSGLSSLDSLLEASSGKPVLLNFWATWCSPCVRELPLLETLAESAGRGAVVIAVSLGDNSIGDVRRFLEERPLGLTFVWLDTGDAAALSERLGLPEAVPVTLFLDAGGSEVARAVGARDYSWFASNLRLAASGSSPDSTGAVEEGGLHVNIVGLRSDSLALELEAEAVRLAGSGAVDFYDPSVPAESAAAVSLFLPLEDLPYAQPCRGGACGRPVTDPAELEDAIARLVDP